MNLQELTQNADNTIKKLQESTQGEGQGYYSETIASVRSPLPTSATCSVSQGHRVSLAC